MQRQRMRGRLHPHVGRAHLIRYGNASRNGGGDGAGLASDGFDESAGLAVHFDAGAMDLQEGIDIGDDWLVRSAFARCRPTMHQSWKRKRSHSQ